MRYSACSCCELCRAGHAVVGTQPDRPLSSPMTLRTPVEVADRLRQFVLAPRTGEAADTTDLGPLDLLNIAALLGGMLGAAIDEITDHPSEFDAAITDVIDSMCSDPGFAVELWAMAERVDRR